MAKKFIQPGEVIDFVAGANISSGDVVAIGSRVGVALTDIANGATGPVQVTGVWEVPVLATDVVTQGAVLYWDPVNTRMTITAGALKVAGYAFEASGNGVATVKIKLNA